jgi:hypothetical protein
VSSSDQADTLAKLEEAAAALTQTPQIATNVAGIVTALALTPEVDTLRAAVAGGEAVAIVQQGLPIIQWAAIQHFVNDLADAAALWAVAVKAFEADVMATGRYGLSAFEARARQLDHARGELLGLIERVKQVIVR